MEFFSLFVLLAGYVIGLGAVTVIDSLGFLARRSGYWTETTIRAHRVTKPLIWLGIGLVLIGSLLYYPTYATGVSWLQFLLLGVLIGNGIFLSFYVSPRLKEQERLGQADQALAPAFQKVITVSFLISFFGWWGSLLLLLSRLV